MDILTLAFTRLQQLGKASIQYGIPIYNWEELVDMMIEIKNRISSHRKKCPKCGKIYSIFEADEYCLKCNVKFSPYEHIKKEDNTETYKVNYKTQHEFGRNFSEKKHPVKSYRTNFNKDLYSHYEKKLKKDNKC